ncbi:hypothetical protein OE766_18660 [Pararhizobium sp. YC-54]|uniref:hypothetical protein n=1 Tax=Pararhizobium sp. YC-54 TaxID=2986920 RepID=UPI0021F6BD06|nr:hypothetical protein [Pararhizobium sp. YC-54]MCW0000261.1 hypothetical protein [Pararhizobium sp. YC-54]
MQPEDLAKCGPAPSGAVRLGANRPRLKSLPSGLLIASAGPTIGNIALHGETVKIECSAVIQIIVVGRGSKNEAISGTDMTSAQFPLKKFIGDWCRVMIMAADGKLAWSNPIYL